MKNFTKIVFSWLFIAAMFLGGNTVQARKIADWTKPIVVVEKTQYQLGEQLKVDYYNAPSGASVVIYETTADFKSPTFTKSLSSTKGSVSFTLPGGTTAYAFKVAMCTPTETLCEPVSVIVDAHGKPLEMSKSVVHSAAKAKFAVTLKNAPVCKGDRLVAYPANYTVVEQGEKGFQTPAAEVSVTEADCSIDMSIATAGTYIIYYMVGGTYYSLGKTDPIIVGSPIELTFKSQYTTEDNIEISYNNASGTGLEWIGIFKNTNKPKIMNEELVCKLPLDKNISGKVSVTGGTLVKGRYRIAAFFAEETSQVSIIKTMQIVEDANSLIFSNAETETYYNITNVFTNGSISTEGTSTSARRNVILSELKKGDAKYQWRLVKREDGTIDFINRATGEYLLTTSVMNNALNLSQMGKSTDGLNGWKMNVVSSGVYRIFAVEDDGVTRHLTDSPIGGEAQRLDQHEVSYFYWNFAVAETVVTGIKGAKKNTATIVAQNGKISVTGTKDYTIWNEEGVQVPSNTNLQPGVYFVKFNGEKATKVLVK